MEFKPNRYQNSRGRVTVPQRVSDIRPTPKPQPIQTKPTTSSPPVPVPQSNAPKKANLFTRKNIVIGASALVVISIVVVLSIHGASSTPSTANKPTLTESIGYQTILPNGKSINDLGGWKRVSPDNEEPVYAYVDSIDGVPISVSEQPLPKTFEGDAETQVAEVAKKFNANQKLSAGDTTIYLGTSAKGPQSAIFIKINLLVLIKSEKKISDDAWIKYVKSLTV